MDRTFKYIPTEPCDWCGMTGSFDFYGDYICQECINMMLLEEDDDKAITNQKDPKS